MSEQEEVDKADGACLAVSPNQQSAVEKKLEDAACSNALNSTSNDDNSSATTKTRLEIQVSFVTKKMDLHLHKELIANILRRYGSLVSFEMKKYSRDAKVPSQSGYGFAAYDSIDDGLQTYRSLKNTDVEQIHFDCNFSHRNLNNFPPKERQRILESVADVPSKPIKPKRTPATDAPSPALDASKMPPPMGRAASARAATQPRYSSSPSVTSSPAMFYPYANTQPPSMVYSSAMMQPPPSPIMIPSPYSYPSPYPSYRGSPYPPTTPFLSASPSPPFVYMVSSSSSDTQPPSPTSPHVHTHLQPAVMAQMQYIPEYSPADGGAGGPRYQYVDNRVPSTQYAQFSPHQYAGHPPQPPSYPSAYPAVYTPQQPQQPQYPPQNQNRGPQYGKRKSVSRPSVAFVVALRGFRVVEFS
eukprot:gene33371-40375_t